MPESPLSPSCDNRHVEPDSIYVGRAPDQRKTPGHRKTRDDGDL